MAIATATFRPDLVPHRPWTVCFYSFRGGVGRTTLALSTALNLAEDPESKNPAVFVLDFDIEAPGIDEFDKFRPQSPEQKGLLEYVGDYLDSGSAKPPRLNDYVYPGGGKTRSGLHVMRAGTKGDSYIKRLAQLDWSDFYRCQHGLEFFENMRVGAKREFGCDYMIVDSRTGLTEIGGICTGHLADAVALVFQPTTAHSEGLRAVSRAIRRREELEGRPIPRLYIASRCRLLYADSYDPETLNVARSVVIGCEDGAAPQEVYAARKATPDVDLLVGEPDPSKATLVFVQEREKVSSPQKPDAYIVAPQFEPGIFTMSPEEQEYVLVKYWIEVTRRSAQEAFLG